jgi:hypothetical protein
MARTEVLIPAGGPEAGGEENLEGLGPPGRHIGEGAILQEQAQHLGRRRLRLARNLEDIENRC